MPYDTKMPFGQHKDLRIIELPINYCQWLLYAWEGAKNMSPSLKKALMERLKIHREETEK